MKSNEELDRVQAAVELKNTFREDVEADLAKAAKDLGERPTDRRPVKPVRLQEGDTIRANGCLYRVRKVTRKDVVLRLLGVENQPRVGVPRG